MTPPPTGGDAPTPPAGDAAPATVTIHLESTPPGAEVYVGKTRRGVTPLDLTAPRGARPLAVRLERAGYRVQSLALSVERDGQRVVTLTKRQPIPDRGGGDDGFANPFAK